MPSRVMGSTRSRMKTTVTDSLILVYLPVYARGQRPEGEHREPPARCTARSNGIFADVIGLLFDYFNVQVVPTPYGTDTLCEFVDPTRCSHGILVLLANSNNSLEVWQLPFDKTSDDHVNVLQL